MRPALAALSVVVLALGGAEPRAATDAESLIAAADPAAGHRVFQMCKACRTAERGGRNLTGPNLWGGMERRKAAVEGFRNAQAVASLGSIWDYADLDANLLPPRTYL